MPSSASATLDLRDAMHANCGALADTVLRIDYLIGWRGYFGFCETPTVLRALEQWTRRRWQGTGLSNQSG